MAETEKLRSQSTSRACIKAADTRIKLENRRPRSPNGTPIAHTECKEDSEKSDNIERKPGCLTDPDISGNLKIYGAEGLFSKANLASTFKELSLQSLSVNSRNTAMERPIFVSSETATSKQSVSSLKANFEQGQEFLDSSHKQHITEFTNPLHRGNKQRFQGGTSTVHSVKAVKPPIAPKLPSPAVKRASPVKKPLPPLAPKPASPARKPDSFVNDKPTSDLKCVNQGDLTNRKPLQLYEEIPSTLLDSKEHQFIDEEDGYSTVVHNNKTTVPSHPHPRQLVNINIANINKQLHESPSAEQETEKEKESEKSTEIPVYAQVIKKKPQTLDDNEAGSSKIPVFAKVNKPKSKTLDSSEGESSNIPVYAKVNKPKSKTLDSTCNVESPTVIRETRSESDPTPKNASVESKTEPKVSVAKEEAHNMDKEDSMKDNDSDFGGDDDEAPWDSDEFDDESDFDDNKDQDSRSLTQDDEEHMVFADEKSKKLYNIAKEILTTERAYVRRLHLLDQVFYSRLENECLTHGHIPQEVMHDVFSNISAIHKLHKDFFLPKLEERMSEWSTNNKIGDILKTLAPFLKLYTAYIANFDKSSETLATWTKKSPKFAAVIEDIQKSSECENLTLGHHMLEPIQRVPRYKLLLKDYLSKLPEDSPDYKNCQDAMEIISEAAAHANDSMKKMERFKKLLELQDRLLEGIDLITASRVFIKEGDLTKVAARSSTGHQERTLLLFNDILLCCAKVPGTNKLKVKVQMDLDGMEIGDADEDVELSNTFRVTSKQKVIDFSASTEEDKGNWTKALQEAIQELVRKRESYKRGIQSEPISECDLGKKAPAWVRDEAVTMCMSCDTMFTLTKRRHHCRACGAIFCNGCCNAKAALEYAGGKQSRVCLTCYNIIVSGAKRSVLKKKDEEKKTLDVRKIDSQTKVLLSGYLKYKGGSEKNWVKRWCVLSDNFVFYCYKAKKDTKAAFSIPLPGYVVDKPNLADDINRKIAFKIHHKNMVKHFFAPDGEESLKRWMHNLSYAVKAERIPEEGETTNEPENKEERSSSMP